MPSRTGGYDASASGPQRKKRPRLIFLSADIAEQFAIGNDEKPAKQVQRWVTESASLPELEELLNRDKQP
jgi:hypothetical protein